MTYGKSWEIWSFWTTSKGRQNMDLLWSASWFFQHLVVQGKKKKNTDEINDQENQNEGKENMRFYLVAQNRQLHDKVTTYMEWKEHFLVYMNTISWSRKSGGPWLARKESYLILGITWPQLLETPTNEVMLTIFSLIIESNLWSAKSRAQVQMTPKSWTEEQEIGSF